MITVRNGYERNKRVTLPERKPKLNLNDPVQASAAAAVIRANKTGDYENAGNALALATAVQVVDHTQIESTLVVTEYEFINSKNGTASTFPTMQEGLELAKHDPDWQFSSTVKVNVG